MFRFAFIAGLLLISLNLSAQTASPSGDGCVRALKNMGEKIRFAHDKLNLVWDIWVTTRPELAPYIDLLIAGELPTEVKLILAELVLRMPLSSQQSAILTLVNEKDFYVRQHLLPPLDYGAHSSTHLLVLSEKLREAFTPAQTSVLLRMGLGGR